MPHTGITQRLFEPVQKPAQILMRSQAANEENNRRIFGNLSPLARSALTLLVMCLLELRIRRFTSHVDDITIDTNIFYNLRFSRIGDSQNPSTCPDSTPHLDFPEQPTLPARKNQFWVMFCNSIVHSNHGWQPQRHGKPRIHCRKKHDVNRTLCNCSAQSIHVQE